MDTIRLILNLPRCGGTLFSRLLSAHPDVFLLSEVHPANQGADIRARLSEFFRMELPDSVTGWHDSVRHVTGTESRHVVVRDHTHVDFTAATGTSYRLVTLEALARNKMLRAEHGMVFSGHLDDAYAEPIRVGLLSHVSLSLSRASVALVQLDDDL